MKILLTIVLFTLLSTLAFAQAPSDAKAPATPAVKEEKKAEKKEAPTQLSAPLQIGQQMNAIQAMLEQRNLELDAAQSKVQAAQSEITSLKLAAELQRREALDSYDIPKAERSLWQWKATDKGFVLVKVSPPADKK